MTIIKAVYDAKYLVIRNRAAIRNAMIRRDFSTAKRLQEQTAKVRNEILRKYGVIIDY